MDLPEVPEGWTAEKLSSIGQALIKSPDHLMVTVDFRLRGFRSGLVTTGRMTSTKTYNGRGWKQLLVNDAVQHLVDVVKRSK